MSCFLFKRWRNVTVRLSFTCKFCVLSSFRFYIRNKNSPTDSSLYNRGGERAAIHQKGEGFDSRLIQVLFIMKISLTSLGMEYFRACHTMYTYRGSDQLVNVKVLISSTLSWGAGLVPVGEKNKEKRRSYMDKRWRYKEEKLKENNIAENTNS